MFPIDKLNLPVPRALRWAALCLILAAATPSFADAPEARDQTRRVTIVAINDFHGALYELPDPHRPGMAWGGLPFLAGAIAKLRAEVPDLVLLDGGDLFQGSWPVNATRGIGGVEAFELLGVDASAVGNHEFDYGGVDGGDPLRGALLEAARRAPFAWLSANIGHTTPDGIKPWNPEGIRPWTVIERGGVRIGLIGITTMSTPSTTRPENVVDLRFGDPVDAVARVLPEVKAAGAEVVVVLAHVTGECMPIPDFRFGAPCDPGEELGALIHGLPRGAVDVIVAGHAHTLIATRKGDTFVVQAWAQGRAMNRIDLVVGKDGVVADDSVLHAPWMMLHPKVDPGCDGGEHPLDARDLGGRVVEPSAKALALVRRLEGASGGGLCEPVTCTVRPLFRSRTTTSDVGRLITDAMLGAFEGADVAIQNSGGLRADLPLGVVRRVHVQDVMPFPNETVLVEMTGERLRLLLRIGSSGAHGAMQVAGAAYRYDPAQKGGTDLNGDGAVAQWERDRLCSVTVGGRPLDPARRYKVVVSDFLLSGGDHMAPALASAKVLGRGPLLRQVLERHLRAHEGCHGADPEPQPERVVVGPCDPPVKTPVHSTR